MNKAPFIKKFENDTGEKYVYCASTNRIMKVEDIIYDIIDYFHVYDSETIAQKLNYKYALYEIKTVLEELELFHKETRFADSKRPERIDLVVTKDEFHQKLYNSMTGIHINLTNNCNLSCAYCLYGEAFYNKRKSVPQAITTEIALKAVEFLVKHSHDSKRISLGFYGGEPFLNFDVMKQATLYMQEMNDKNRKKELYVHLTSNGTLINDEIIQWLISNDVGLLISFDGPKHLHDRYRIFKDGNGTYEVIMDNLKNIKNKDEAYYLRRVSFNIVLAPPFDFKGLVEFLESHDLISHKFIASVLIYDRNDYFLKIERQSGTSAIEFQNQVLDTYFMLQSQFSEEKKNELDILFRINKIPLERFMCRESCNSCDQAIKNPLCELGLGRSFILNDGSIYPCERIEQFPFLELGNVFEGFYKSKRYGTKSWELMCKFLEFLDNRCCECWAFRFCSNRTCLKYASSPVGLSQERFENNCNKFRDNAVKYLKKYMYYDEKYPDVVADMLQKRKMMLEYTNTK